MFGTSCLLFMCVGVLSVRLVKVSGDFAGSISFLRESALEHFLL